MERRKFTREFKLEAGRLIKDRGVSYVQASQDLGVHLSQLRDWVKKFADNPQHAFPGNGQMKPEQAEIARLKREVIKLKAERDILKKAVPGSWRVTASLRCAGRDDAHQGAALRRQEDDGLLAAHEVDEGSRFSFRSLWSRWPGCLGDRRTVE